MNLKSAIANLLSYLPNESISYLFMALKHFGHSLRSFALLTESQGYGLAVLQYVERAWRTVESRGHGHYLRQTCGEFFENLGYSSRLKLILHSSPIPSTGRVSRWTWHRLSHVNGTAELSLAYQPFSIASLAPLYTKKVQIKISCKNCSCCCCCFWSVDPDRLKSTPT